MYSLIKKMVPSFLKSFYWQKYLRLKFCHKNCLGKRIIFSKDLILGINCKVCDDVSIGGSVKLADNVSVGKDTIIENIEVDNDSMIDGRVICTGHGNGKIILGQNSYIGINNILDWSNNITIGNFVHIAGPSTGLWTHSSALMCLNSIPIMIKNEEFRPTAPIVVEDNVYIGGNCTIYPGITIRHHSIIAPNSAVTKNVEPYTMVGGVPAKKIKDIQKH